MSTAFVAFVISAVGSVVIGIVCAITIPDQRRSVLASAVGCLLWTITVWLAVGVWP